MVAERLAQRLESSEIDSRVLIASALRAVQTVGRFIGAFRQLEKVTREQLAEVHAVLFPAGPSATGGLKAAVAATLRQGGGSSGGGIGAVYASLLMQQDPHASSELKRFFI